MLDKNPLFFMHAYVLILVLSVGSGFKKVESEPYQNENAVTRTLLLSGESYYVSPSGNDSNPGTKSQPWRRIQHAADMVTAGDTVYVRQGIYNEYIQLNRNGNSNNYIIFQAYSDETPVIEGVGMGIGTAVRIYCSYIKLIGFEIRNCDTGIEMTGHHIEISDCDVHDLWFGISPHNGCHDFILNRVNIYNFILYGFDASRWGSSEPVCYNGIFYNCLAYNCLDTG